MANEQVDVVATQIEKQRKGYFGLSLSGMTTSSAPTIISGSVIEIAGSLFQFTSDESINASSWTAISTASDVYIYLQSDGATSATLTAYYTDDTPVWREDYNGWYLSAGSSIRVVAGVYKTSAVAYDNKKYLQADGGHQYNRDLYIKGALKLTEQTNGTMVIPSASHIILSAGTYMVYFPTTHPDAASHMAVDIYNDTSASWKTLFLRQYTGLETEYTLIGGVVISDGTNVRIRNTSAVSTYTVDIWKY